MLEIWTDLINSPMAIPIIAIIVGVGIPVITSHWFELEKHKEDSKLKRAMIERGMSVEEIERVLAAKSPGDKKETRSRKKAWRDRSKRAAAQV